MRRISRFLGLFKRTRMAEVEEIVDAVGVHPERPRVRAHRRRGPRHSLHCRLLLRRRRRRHRVVPLRLRRRRDGRVLRRLHWRWPILLQWLRSAPIAVVRVDSRLETSRRRKGQQRFRWTRENNDRQTGTVEWKKVTVFRWQSTVGPTIRARPLLFTERACPLCCRDYSLVKLLIFFGLHKHLLQILRISRNVQANEQKLLQILDI